MWPFHWNDVFLCHTETKIYLQDFICELLFLFLELAQSYWESPYSCLNTEANSLLFHASHRKKKPWIFILFLNQFNLIIRLGIRYLYPLSHLTGPHYPFGFLFPWLLNMSTDCWLLKAQHPPTVSLATWCPLSLSPDPTCCCGGMRLPCTAHAATLRCCLRKVKWFKKDSPNSLCLALYFCDWSSGTESCSI